MSTLRRYVTPMAIVAAVAVLYIMFPYDVLGLDFAAPSKDLSTAAAVVFWVLSIVIVLVLFQDRKAPEAQTVDVEGPAFARYLFSNTRAGLLWLPIRLFVGAQWLEAGLHKLQGTGWMAEPPSRGSGPRPPQCPKVGVRRSPTSGIAASSGSCSTTTPTARSAT
jgi:hypothetical protein